MMAQMTVQTTGLKTMRAQMTVQTMGLKTAIQTVLMMMTEKLKEQQKLKELHSDLMTEKLKEPYLGIPLEHDLKLRTVLSI